MNISMYSHFSEMVRKLGLEKACAYARSLGFTGVELIEMTDEPEFIKDVAEAKKVKQLLDNYGLKVVCYTFGTTVMRESWEDNPAERALMNYVDIAAAMDCPLLHHTLMFSLTIPPDAPKYEDILEPIVAMDQRVADYAKNKGVTVIVEEQGMYFNGREGLGPFITELKKRCSNVGICGDFGNMYFVDDDPVEFMRVFAKDVKHVHLKDYIRREKNDPPKDPENWLRTKGGAYLLEVRPGEGSVDYAACLGILKEAGYDGFFSMENNDKGPYEDGVAAGKDLLTKYFYNEK